VSIFKCFQKAICQDNYNWGQEDEPLDSAPGEHLDFSGQVYTNSGLCPRESLGFMCTEYRYTQILDSALESLLIMADRYSICKFWTLLLECFLI
jgi:hypothetical protein